MPCLVVKDASGAVTLTLNEGSAVLQWIADHSAKTEALAGAWGSDKRYRVQNLLNFVASEVHASTGPLWNPALDAEAKARQQAIMHKVCVCRRRGGPGHSRAARVVHVGGLRARHAQQAPHSLFLSHAPPLLSAFQNRRSST